VKKQLGNWSKPIKDLRRHYRHYKQDNKLYTRIRRGQNFEVTEDKKNTETVKEVPQDAVPTAVSLLKTLIYSNREKVETNTEESVTHQIQESIPEEVIVATDASVRNKTAAWAWIMADKNGQIIKQESRKIQEFKISSYREEEFGIMAACETMYPIL
jgi:hypothetical protein